MNCGSYSSRRAGWNEHDRRLAVSTPVCHHLSPRAGEGPTAELGALTNEFGAEEAANRIAAVIPRSATHDPHAWLADYAGAWEKAGLLLGLCLGFRVASGLYDKSE